MGSLVSLPLIIVNIGIFFLIDLCNSVEIKYLLQIHQIFLQI